MRPLITLRKLKSVEAVEKPIRSPFAIDANSAFIYTNGSDVMKTFKRYGFVPPTEYRNDYLFKKNREMNNE
jgi:hypothetical protein